MTSTPDDSQSQPEQSDMMDISAIVQQLEDLVKFSIECEEKELKPNVSFIDIHKKLLQIQQDIQLFQDNFRTHLALYGLKPEDVKPTSEEIDSLDPKQRKIFERMDALKQTCESARDRLYQSMQQDPETLKVVKEELKDKSKQKIRRKGKFKGMGGKEGWIPT